MQIGIPEGTRDFSPAQVVRRNYIFDTIRRVFVKYGFQPLETPAMERLDTLTGKYGEEGDRLLFKILNNGNYLADVPSDLLEKRDSSGLTSHISRRGLRYDLTVPFARYVSMHFNELAFPFKRYQIQPVWRADRPQRGRYREFYQCDVDVVGANALMHEAELVQIYDEVFAALGLGVVIRINNRKILAGMAETAGIADQLALMTIAIDKLDKTGIEGVKEELARRAIPGTAIAHIEALLAVSSLDELREAFANSTLGLQGIDEVEEVLGYLADHPASNVVKFDISLARGLDYYTGCIFEVVVDAQRHPDLKMGSIGGGGRYDNLTGIFGRPGLSGVGVSFGAERIYDLLEESGLFPAEDPAALKLLLLAFDDTSHLRFPLSAGNTWSRHQCRSVSNR
jgi:histidyl-tRNA synthetase